MIKHGDILMSNNGKLLSNIITGVTGADRSHVGIIKYDQGWQFQDAMERGVIQRPLLRYLEQGEKDLRLMRFTGDLNQPNPLDPIIREFYPDVPLDFNVRTNFFLGLNYGYLDLTVHHLAYESKTIRKILGNRWIGKATEGWKEPVCSELIAYSYCMPHPYRTTPKMIEDYPLFKTIWYGSNKEMEIAVKGLMKYKMN